MKTMLDLYKRNATLYPDREMYICANTRRTYGAFYDRTRQLSSAMETAGLKRQEVVAVFAANCVEYFEIYGASEVGAFIATAFNFRSAPPELEYLIGHAEPRILFFDAAGLAAVSAVKDNVNGILSFVFMGAGTPDWAIPFEEFLTQGNPDGPSSTPQPDDFCNMFYTSGTTGRPKGVPYTHQSLLTTASRTALEEEISLLQVTPVFHVGGRCPSLGAIWNAGKTVVHCSFDPFEWQRTVQDERINVTFMVPMMMEAVMDHPEFGTYDLSSLQWVMAASTTIPTPLLTRAIQAIGPVFYVAYGSTEAGGMTRLRRIETRADGPAEMTARLASVGHPETPVDIVLLDDAGNLVPQGEVGEVCVKSYCFFGYWKNPEATADTMHGEYLRTGDMGRFDERNYLFLVDRRKDMIISGGENIYSREVEDALHRHPAVRSTAVIGVPDERWGERVVAVVALKAGEELAGADLIAFSQTQLARFKCPKEIVFIDDLPLSGTGKVDKLLLRKTYAQPIEVAR